MSLFGNIMRGMEILGVVAYFGYIMTVLYYFTLWFELTDGNDSKVRDANRPDCLVYKSKFKEWSFNSLEWMIIELMVFVFYLTTMIILLIKSRFTKVGVDQSGQFEPIYLQKMID